MSTEQQSAENDARPDVPRVGLFNRHADAVAEASFRAAVSRRRYRVRWEPNNRWWQITEAWPNVHVIPPAMDLTTPTPAAPSRRAEVNGEGDE